jgi:hypothetical protein
MAQRKADKLAAGAADVWVASASGSDAGAISRPAVADHGTKADALATRAPSRSWAAEQLDMFKTRSPIRSGSAQLTSGSATTGPAEPEAVCSDSPHSPVPTSRRR